MHDQLDQSRQATKSDLNAASQLLNWVGPLPFVGGRWRCSRCGAISAAAQDFDTGLVLDGGRCLRHHQPRWTLVCLHPTCRHVEVVQQPGEFADHTPPALVEVEAEARATISPAVAQLLKPLLPGRPSEPDRSDPQRHASPPTHPADDSLTFDHQNEDVAATAWRRVQSALHRLFEALADLDEAGGMAAVAATRGWKPRRWAKNLGTIGLLRRMLDDAIQRGRDDRNQGQG